MIADLPNEKWLDIRGFRHLYRVSNMGRVKSLARTRRFGPNRSRSMETEEIILRPSVHQMTGVLNVSLCKDGKTTTRSVARLVASAFLVKWHSSCEVVHRDGNKNNCAAHNLQLRFGRTLHRRGRKLPPIPVTEIPGEIWKDYPRVPEYQASTAGRVRRKEYARKMKCCKTHKVTAVKKARIIRPTEGRIRMHCRRKSKGSVGAKEVVAETFIRKIKPHETVIHIDGDITNFALSNLKIVDRKGRRAGAR